MAPDKLRSAWLWRISHRAAVKGGDRRADLLLTGNAVVIDVEVVGIRPDAYRRSGNGPRLAGQPRPLLPDAVVDGARRDVPASETSRGDSLTGRGAGPIVRHEGLKGQDRVR